MAPNRCQQRYPPSERPKENRLRLARRAQSLDQASRTGQVPAVLAGRARTIDDLDSTQQVPRGKIAGRCADCFPRLRIDGGERASVQVDSPSAAGGNAAIL